MPDDLIGPDEQEEAIARAERALRASLIVALQNPARLFDVDAIAALIERGRLEEAIQATQGAWEVFADRWTDIYVRSGRNAMGRIGAELAQAVFFDQTTTLAVEDLRENRLRLVQEFTRDQREAAEVVITRGIQENLNPRAQARELFQITGLTRRQEEAVENYRRLLREGSRQALERALRDRRFDRTVARAVSGDRPLTEEQVDRMVERYRDRYRRHRATVIARTEALRSVHSGHEQSFQQAVDQGVVEPDAVRRFWNTARDARVRDSHAGMNGQERRLGELFVSDDGNRLRWPGDIQAPVSETAQCRCVLSTRLAV